VRTGMGSVTSCFEQSNVTSSFIKCKENFMIISKTVCSQMDLFSMELASSENVSSSTTRACCTFRGSSF